MAKRNNYTNYGKMANQTAEVIPEEVKEEVVVAEDILATVDSVEETTTETRVGVVSDCKQLNIRKEPSIDADKICVVSAGALLVIEPDKSTDEWYKIYTEAGIEGFCMKKFVTLK